MKGTARNLKLGLERFWCLLWQEPENTLLETNGKGACQAKGEGVLELEVTESKNSEESEGWKKGIRKCLKRLPGKKNLANCLPSCEEGKILKEGFCSRCGGDVGVFLSSILYVFCWHGESLQLCSLGYCVAGRHYGSMGYWGWLCSYKTCSTRAESAFLAINKACSQWVLNSPEGFIILWHYVLTLAVLEAWSSGGEGQHPKIWGHGSQPVKVDSPFWVEGELFPKMYKSKYHGVWFTSEGRLKHVKVKLVTFAK